MDREHTMSDDPLGDYCVQLWLERSLRLVDLITSLTPVSRSMSYEKIHSTYSFFYKRGNYPKNHGKNSGLIAIYTISTVFRNSGAHHHQVLFAKPGEWQPIRRKTDRSCLLLDYGITQWSARSHCEASSWVFFVAFVVFSKQRWHARGGSEWETKGDCTFTG